MPASRYRYEVLIEGDAEDGFTITVMDNVHMEQFDLEAVYYDVEKAEADAQALRSFGNNIVKAASGGSEEGWVR